MRSKKALAGRTAVKPNGFMPGRGNSKPQKAARDHETATVIVKPRRSSNTNVTTHNTPAPIYRNVPRPWHPRPMSIAPGELIIPRRRLFPVLARPLPRF